MKKAILASALTLSMAPLAQADFIGLYLGAYAWDTGYDGFVKDGPNPSDELDVIDTMGIEDEANNVFYIAFEHPIPFLPNIKLVSTELKASGESATANFTYGDTQFNASIESEFDFSFTDATLYYEILDNVVSLDIGLTARAIDGTAKIAGNGFVNGAAIATYSSEEGEFDPTLPMLYAMVGVDLPFSGLSVRSEINYLGWGGDETDGLSDMSVYINYEAAFGLGVMAGYRDFSFKYEDGDKEADLSMNGAFLGLSFHF